MSYGNVIFVRYRNIDKSKWADKKTTLLLSFPLVGQAGYIEHASFIFMSRAWKFHRFFCVCIKWHNDEGEVEEGKQEEIGWYEKKGCVYLPSININWDHSHWIFHCWEQRADHHSLRLFGGDGETRNMKKEDIRQNKRHA